MSAYRSAGLVQVCCEADSQHNLVCATMNMSTHCLQALGDLALKFGVAADAGLGSTDLVYDRCRTSNGITYNVRDTTARGCSSQVECAGSAKPREGQCGASYRSIKAIAYRAQAGTPAACKWSCQHIYSVCILHNTHLGRSCDLDSSENGSGGNSGELHGVRPVRCVVL